MEHHSLIQVKNYMWGDDGLLSIWWDLCRHHEDFGCPIDTKATLHFVVAYSAVLCPVAVSVVRVINIIQHPIPGRSGLMAVGI